MENKKELTPEQEAEEWLMKVRGYEKAPDYDDWCYWKDGAFVYLTDLTENSLIFFREVVEVMNGFGYYLHVELDDGSLCVWKSRYSSLTYWQVSEDVSEWPLAALKAAKQTPEIRKIMEEYDEKTK